MKPAAAAAMGGAGACTASINIVLLGPGLVGAEVLRQIRAYNATGRFPALRVCAVANSRTMLLPAGTDAQQPEAAAVPDDDWDELLATHFNYKPSTTVQGNLTGGNCVSVSPTATSGSLSRWTATPVKAVAAAGAVTGTDAASHVDTLVDMFAGESAHATVPGVHGCMLIDCTSSDAVANKYPSILRRGVHIVTPNKKAFSSELGLYREIVKACRKVAGAPYPLCLHESTVGAGLPILSTLNDMVATGDRVTRIEGVFSGTLSYLFNEFSTPAPLDAKSAAFSTSRRFSDILSKAKELGYTEPDPRDDLNGIDVARKVVILSRIAKIDLALETLPVENVVPPELRAVATAEEFMAKLPQFDDYFARLNSEARAKHRVLRLVGVVCCTPPGKDGRSSEVKLKSYPFSHPFAQLRGSDNIVAFYTDRYAERPLIVQGSGAGAGVTAAGVLGDALKIAEIVCYGK